MNSQALHFLYIFLSTSGLISVLVMDEEVLVLLCWVLFVGLSYICGSTTINIIFEERRAKFYKDMVVSYDFQKEFLNVLINYHIVRVLLMSEVKYSFNSSKIEIARLLFKYQAGFKFIIGSQLEHKLFILADKEITVGSQVQDIINSRVSINVLKRFKPKNKQVRALKKKILSKSMTKFKSITNS
jgi:hypothetical protein